MKLYIEYQNGNILNHPIFEDNLKQVIPDFYVTDLVSKPYNPEVRNFISLHVPLLQTLPPTNIIQLLTMFMIQTFLE